MKCEVSCPLKIRISFFFLFSSTHNNVLFIKLESCLEVEMSEVVTYLHCAPCVCSGLGVDRLSVLITFLAWAQHVPDMLRESHHVLHLVHFGVRHYQPTQDHIISS